MSEETEEGAIATVRYFIDAVNMAYATNDPSYFEDLATDDCKLCTNIAGDIREAGNLGQVFEEYTLELGKITKAGEMKEGWFGVEAEVKQPKLQARNPDGSVEEISSAATVTSTVFVLDFIDGRWLLKAAVS